MCHFGTYQAAPRLTGNKRAIAEKSLAKNPPLESADSADKASSAWFPLPLGPVRVLATVTLSVFVGELLIMLLLSVLPPMPMMLEAVLDATLLLIVISPALFYFLFIPIIRHVKIREEAEELLRKNRDLLQSVFNGFSEPIMLLDEQLKVKLMNRAARDYYGLNQAVIDDLPCHRVLMCQDQPCAECEIPMKIHENRNISFERKGRFDPNRIEQVYLYRTASPYQPSGVIIARITDITEKRQMEQQAQRKEHMASLGLLISGVAHEINNPNNFISFNLPILKDYLDEIIPIVDAHAAQHPDLEIANMSYADFRLDLFKIVENVTHGSSRINTIVSKLKEFSRLKESRRRSKVDIRAVLDKVVALTNSQIKRMVRHFDYQVPAELPLIYTDGQAIEQMVLNLLINACQAADKPDSRVRLAVSLDPKPPYVLGIEVSDNGCGMDDTVLARIFNPLFTTKGPHEGTGLGLYVCHNLAEGIGGCIEVQSTSGQGSTFRILLPDLRHPLPSAEATVAMQG